MRNQNQENMEKIFILDSHRAYGRLIKLEFGKAFEIHCPHDYNSFKEIDFTIFNFAFIIIHNYEELVHAIPIIQTVPNIILGSKLENIEEVSIHSDNIMFIDVNQPKSELIGELKSLFSLFSTES